MTFFVSHSASIHKSSDFGIFVHVPKCAGSSIQDYLSQFGLNLFRPYPSMNHHRSFSESLSYIDRLGKKPKFSIIPWRHPLEWRLSIFNYAIKENPDISFMPLENALFSKIGFNKYIDILLGISNSSLPKLSRSELPWSTLWSWLVQPFFNELMPDTVYLVNSSFPVQFSIKTICEIEFNLSLTSCLDDFQCLNCFTDSSERNFVLSTLPENIKSSLVRNDLSFLYPHLNTNIPMHTFSSSDWINISRHHFHA